MAAVRTAGTASALVAAPVAGPILDTVGHGPTFAVAGVVGALSAAAFGRLRILRPRVAPRPPPWRLVRGALRNRTFRSYTIAYNMQALGGLLMVLAIPIVLVDEFDASFSTVGVLTLLQGLAGVVGYSLWGRLSDRRSGPFSSLCSNSVGLVVGVAFIAAILLSNVWLLAFAFVARGLHESGYDIGWLTSLTSMAKPEETSALASTFLVTVGVRGLIFPFVSAALVVAVGTVGTFATALGVLVVGSFLMLRVVRSFVPVSEEAEAG